MNVLLTGGTGFVGQRLRRCLIEQGHLVRTLSHSCKTGQNNIYCDLMNDSIPIDLFNSIDVVFHLAGFAHDLRESSEVEHLYYKLNTYSTIKLAKLAAISGVHRFIFVSSVKAGGDKIVKNFRGQDIQNGPEGIYGKSKLKAELGLLKICRKTSMNVSIVRPSLVYGPGVKGNLHLMLSGIEKGWFPPLPETGNKRSMIHVDDLVRAIVLVSESDGTNGEVFVATDGSAYSSKEIYNAMCTVLGKKIPKWSIPRAVFDFIGVFNSNIKHKLNKLLGDELYSSAKLEALGFKAEKTLKDMNETDF